MIRKATVTGSRPSGSANESEASRSVREMFDRISPRYDLLNRLLSLTMDRVWRRRTARAVSDLIASDRSKALDLCCGTGDLSLELVRTGRGHVVGSDFAPSMLERAAAKSAGLAGRVEWIEADALAMPFADGAFDVVTVAFGFRNLANYRRGLEEMFRLLRPGGRAAILEFSLPGSGVLASFCRFYFGRVLPLIGNWVAGERPGGGAYSYLPESVERFPDCDGLTLWMEEAGFTEVRYQRWTGGIVALHQGAKPR